MNLVKYFHKYLISANYDCDYLLNWYSDKLSRLFFIQNGYSNYYYKNNPNKKSKKPFAQSKYLRKFVKKMLKEKTKDQKIKLL